MALIFYFWFVLACARFLWYLPVCNFFRAVLVCPDLSSFAPVYQRVSPFFASTLVCHLFSAFLIWHYLCYLPSGMSWSVISSGLSCYDITWVNSMYQIILYFMVLLGLHLFFLVCCSLFLFLYFEFYPFILFFIVYYRHFSSPL